MTLYGSHMTILGSHMTIFGSHMTLYGSHMTIYGSHMAIYGSHMTMHTKLSMLTDTCICTHAPHIQQTCRQASSGVFVDEANKAERSNVFIGRSSRACKRAGPRWEV